MPRSVGARTSSSRRRVLTSKSASTKMGRTTFERVTMSQIQEQYSTSKSPKYIDSWHTIVDTQRKDYLPSDECCNLVELGENRTIIGMYGHYSLSLLGIIDFPARRLKYTNIQSFYFDSSLPTCFTDVAFASVAPLTEICPRVLTIAETV